MRKSLIDKVAFLILMFVSILYGAAFGNDKSRVEKYVKLINQHLESNAEVLEPADGIAPFVMDWSEELFMTPYISEDTKEELNKKLTFLAQQTDYRFFVLVTPAFPYYGRDFENIVEEIQKDEQEFSQAVYEQSNLNNVSGKRVILLSLCRMQYIVDSGINGERSINSTVVMGLGASSNVDPTVKDQLIGYSNKWLNNYEFSKKKQHYLLRSRNFDGNGYVKALTNFTYKTLPKPYSLRSYYITYKGEIIELGLQKSPQEVAGKEEPISLNKAKETP